MSGRNLIGVIAASGLIAAVGFMVSPRRRKRRFGIRVNRMPVSLRNMMNVINMSRSLLRAVAR
ncbi:MULTISPECIES: hypothetical protein [Bacillales]|jgi:hypothetical protein|uniref:LPXTG cell wall anchor domain-containing protein n=1 Tax=Brevibacillus aydinogluensis TaxID=927786 RepID=A0AA48M8S3_9BACL|nr:MULTISPECIES: hypothetical protein [Bacillales]REK64563.1 MAG: hypothetical protein DF221_07665 [Brevibacillus sp.]MBR8659399.1 hypothetical protein [Brevibacillus sp. NL20B1]MDT3414436.1 hypothetical protein [Brevibacillus aydinogluensis]NNV02551.1 hypothetical protein [Brevibacillus sp. MCWH]UFJ60021.1 hypothetical protein IRT44_11910 [Anoxybacillus sediminis]